MEKQIPSPFAPRAKANLTQREFRIWHKHQWVLCNYWLYKCEKTSAEIYTAETKAKNREIADKYLEERSK